MNDIARTAFDPILLEDLEDIINRSTSALDVINHSTVLVTGATGLIGSLVIKTIYYANVYGNYDIHAIAMIRNTEKAEWIFGNILKHPNISLTVGDVCQKLKIEHDVDYIIHGANPTASKYFVTHPVETIQSIINGTDNILQLAVEKKIKSMVYLSSMEVYGQVAGYRQVVSEKGLGYIDVLDTRSSYSEGKRMAECLCASYASEYGAPVKMARLALTFGAGADYNSTRVFGQFARAVVEKHDIVLHSTGETLLNYCYTTDAISAIFAILVRGQSGTAYNVSNDKEIYSVRDVAQMLVNKYSDAEIKVVVDIPQDNKTYGYNKVTSHILDNYKIRSIGCQFQVPILNALSRLILTLSNCGHNYKKG